MKIYGPKKFYNIGPWSVSFCGMFWHQNEKRTSISKWHHGIIQNDTIWTLIAEQRTRHLILPNVILISTVMWNVIASIIIKICCNFNETWQNKILHPVNFLHVNPQTELQPEPLRTHGAGLELAPPDHDGYRPIDDSDNLAVVFAGQVAEHGIAGVTLEPKQKTRLRLHSGKITNYYFHIALQIYRTSLWIPMVLGS